MFMYIGCLLLMSGYYYRKPLVYNSLYTYVLIENYINGIRNKYFRSNLNVYTFESHSIIELFDSQFSFKKYILKSNSELIHDNESKQLLTINKDIEFNTTKLFLSIILEFNNTETDLTKEINMFVTKNTPIHLNRTFALILNDFLSLGLDIELLKNEESTILWKVMDHTVKSYEGSELFFKIDETYCLHNLDKFSQDSKS
jgi:hypothetical protein